MSSWGAISMVCLSLLAGEAPTLRSAAAVRALSVEAAATAPPVRLEGVVTFVHAASFGRYGFVQDDTAGIFVFFPDRPALHVGDRVRVRGKVAPGDFAPIVRADQVEVLGRTDLPAPIPADVRALSSGHLDSQWVRTRGQVRLARWDAQAEAYALDVVAENRRIRVDVPGRAGGAELDALWGAEVEVSGVGATIFNQRRQIVGARLMVGAPDQIRVLSSPTVDGNQLPTRPIRDLLRFDARPGADPRVRVQGVVTHRDPPAGFTIEDETGGVVVYARAAPPLGASVDVVGFAEVQGLSPVLRDARYVDAAPRAAPSPRPITKLLEPANDNRLVTVEVQLLDRFSEEGLLVLSAMHEQGILRVGMSTSDPASGIEGAQPGARLRLTGVLRVSGEVSGMRREPDSFALAPATAQLSLRGPADVQVLRAAPFWTAARTWAALGGLASCLLLGVLWVGSLRRRVLRQTRTIREQLAREKTLAREAEAATVAQSAFLANISHEIRTPMNGVVGVADLLRQDKSLDEGQRDYVRIIQQSGRQLLQLLDDLLDLSKLEAGGVTLDAQAVRLRKALDGAVGLIRQRARDKGLELAVDVDPACPLGVRVDAGRLRQVLLNLGMNAVKFTEEGKIMIRVRPEAPDRLRFEVEDTGIGLSKDARSKLFQRFTQADATIRRRYGGTGLGLAICRALVEAMGGEIGVQSEEGAGACFWFTVVAPEVEGFREAPASMEITLEPIPPQGRLRVLLVDDHPVNLKVGERMLERLGHATTTSSSGPEAITALEHEDFDVVLMDVHMPEMSGLECTRIIRASVPPARQPYILALTADASLADRDACIAAGMDEHLSKPMTLDGLRAALQASGASHPAAP